MSDLFRERGLLKFERRPSPVLAEHRPLYKIGQLLLVLRIASRSEKSSLARLHLFNWALKRPDRIEKLLEGAKLKELKLTAWGFDPVVDLALRYAVAEGLVDVIKTGYQILPKGQAFADAVLKDSEILSTERAQLEMIGKQITETMVDNVAKGWETA